MSNVIDNRVVSMEFDNSKFEKNVKQSMSTLDKLKEKLHFKKDVNEGFDEIDEATEKTKVSFGKLEVAVNRYIENMVDSAYRASIRLAKSLSVDQITAGWSKYNEMNANVQTLMNATGKSLSEVNNYLSRLQDYSDETSYSFSEMTSALSQMTTAGAKIEDVIPMVMGVANATAFAGKGAREFSSTIRNITQSYSSGALNLLDWKSLQGMGTSSQKLIEVLIETAEELGTVEKGVLTPSNFADQLREKYITSDVLAKGFTKFAQYSNAIFDAVDSGKYDNATEAIGDMTGEFEDYAIKAFLAAQEAKSFSEAIEATKDAVSSGWSKSFEIVFGNYEKAAKLWTEVSEFLYNVFAKPLISKNNFLESVLGTDDKWKTITDVLENAEIDLDSFKKKLIDTARESGIAIDDFIEEDKSFESTLSRGWLTSGLIVDVLKQFNIVSSKATENLSGITNKLEYFQNLVDKTWHGDFGNGIERIQKFAEYGYDYAKVQSLVNRTVDGHRLSLEELGEEELKAIGYTEDEVSTIQKLTSAAKDLNTPLGEAINLLSRPAGRDLLIDSARNIFIAVGKVVSSISNAWNNIFSGPTAEQAYSFIERFHSFTETLIISDEKAEKITKTFEGFFRILNTIKKVIVKSLNPAFSILQIIFNGISNGALDVGSSFGSLIEKISEAASKSETLQFILSKIGDIFNAAKSSLSSIGKVIKTVFGYVKSAFVYLYNLPVVQKYISDVGKTLRKVFTKISDGFSNFDFSIEGLIKSIKNIGNISLDTLIVIKDYLKEFVQSQLKKAGKSLQSFFSSIINLIKIPLNYITKYGKKAGGILGTIIEKVSSSFMKVLDFITNKQYLDAFNVILGFFLKIKGLKVLIKVVTGISTSIIGLNDSLKNMFSNIGNIFSNVTAFISNVGNSLSTLAKAQKIKAIATALLSFGAAVLLIAGAIFIVSKVDPDRLADAAEIIAGVILVLIGYVVALAALGKYMGGTETAKIGITMAALSIGLALIVNAMSKVADMNVLDIVKSLGTLIVIIIAIVGAINAFDSMSKLSFKNGIGMSLILIALAIAMKMLVGVVEDISKADFKGFYGNIVQFALAMAILVGSAALLGIAGRGALGASLGLLILLGIIKIINHFSAQEIDDAMVKLAVIIGIFDAFALIAQIPFGQNADKIGKAVKSFAVSILIMTLAIGLLTLMDQSKVDNAFKIVETLLITIGAVVAVTNMLGSGASQEGSGKMFKNLALMIVALAASLAVLSALDQNGLITAATAMMIVMVPLSLLIGLSKLGKDSATSLLALAVVIGLVGASLYVLSGVDAEAVIKSAEAMALVFASIALLVGVSKLLDSSNLPAMAMVMILLAEVAAVLAVLSALSPNTVLKVSEAISLAMVSISAALVVCALIGTLTAAVAIGVATFALAAPVMCASLLVCALELRALTTQDLENMKLFAEILDLLSLAFVAFGAGSILNAIGSVLNFFTGGNSLAEFAEELVPFGTAIKELSDTVVKSGGVNKEAIKTTIEAAQMLSDLENHLPKHDGLLQKFLGDNTLGRFAEGLVPFGTAMVEYSTIMKDGNVDKELIEASVSAATVLSEFEKNLPKHGGLVQEWMGDNNLAQFGAGLALFGACLMGFYNSIAGEDGKAKINNEAVEAAKSAGLMMSELENSLPKHGGIVQFWNGETDLKKFGTAIYEYGKAIKKFSDVITEGDGISKDAVENAYLAGELFSSLENGLGKTRDTKIFSLIPTALFTSTETTGLDNLADDLPKLAKALLKYNNTLCDSKWKDIDSDTLKQSDNLLTLFASITKNLPTEEETKVLWGFFSTRSNINGLESFGDGVSVLGEAYRKFVDGINGINENNDVPKSLNVPENFTKIVVDPLINLVTGLSNISVFLKESKDWDLSNFSTAFANLSSAYVTFVNGMQPIYSSETFDPDLLLSSVTPLVDIINSFSEIDISKLKDLKSKSENDKTALDIISDNLSGLGTAYGAFISTVGRAFGTFEVASTYFENNSIFNTSTLNTSNSVLNFATKFKDYIVQPLIDLLNVLGDPELDFTEDSGFLGVMKDGKGSVVKDALTTLGEGFTSFAGSLKGYNAHDILNLRGAADSFTSLFEALKPFAYDPIFDKTIQALEWQIGSDYQGPTWIGQWFNEVIDSFYGEDGKFVFSTDEVRSIGEWLRTFFDALTGPMKENEDVLSEIPNLTTNINGIIDKGIEPVLDYLSKGTFGSELDLWTAIYAFVARVFDKLNSEGVKTYIKNSMSTFCSNITDEINLQLATFTSTGTDIATAIKDGIMNEEQPIRTAIQALVIAINEEFDSAIVITPILDMSSIEDTLTDFAGTYGVNGETTAFWSDLMARAVQNQFNQKPEATEIQNGSKTDNTYNINNTFNITGEADPNVVADKVQKQMYKQYRQEYAARR